MSDDGHGITDPDDGRYTSAGGNFVANYANGIGSTVIDKEKSMAFPPGDSVYCTRDPDKAKQLKRAWQAPYGPLHKMSGWAHADTDTRRRDTRLMPPPAARVVAGRRRRKNRKRLAVLLDPGPRSRLPRERPIGTKAADGHGPGSGVGERGCTDVID